MTEFNAEAQRESLKKQLDAFGYLTRRESGTLAATRLYEDVAQAWCSLTPAQRAATAKEPSDGARFDDVRILPDGNGKFNTLVSSDGDVIIANCSE